MLHDLLGSLRFALASILVLCVGYTGLLLVGAAALAPRSRLGSLLEVDGRIVGSSLIAQDFQRAEYLWPRPSAAGYAADAAGGSNLSPANPAITERAGQIIERLGGTTDAPVPADLVLASGSGLDPHITLEAALFQTARIAAARGVGIDSVERAVRQASRSGLVNVLLANIALDAAMPMPVIPPAAPVNNEAPSGG